MRIKVNRNTTLLEYLEDEIDMSRKTLKQYLKNGSIYVDGVRTTNYAYPILDKSEIIIDTNNKGNFNMPFEILYEDSNLIIIDKPSGILTVSTSKEKEKTVYHIVSTYLKKKHKNAKVFIIHRLDKDTSGILMFAKNEYTKNVFQQNWNDLVKNREYIAVVHGILNEKNKTLINYLKETTTNLVYISKHNTGKKAITKYSVERENGQFSMLKIFIETGRKNQIRVQLSHIGHPILGDQKYGKDNEKRLYLHASKLEFYNPIIKKKMSITSRVPTLFFEKFK